MTPDRSLCTPRRAGGGATRCGANKENGRRWGIPTVVPKKVLTHATLHRIQVGVDSELLKADLPCESKELKILRLPST